MTHALARYYAAAVMPIGNDARGHIIKLKNILTRHKVPCYSSSLFAFKKERLFGVHQGFFVCLFVKMLKTSITVDDAIATTRHDSTRLSAAI